MDELTFDASRNMSSNIDLNLLPIMVAMYETRSVTMAAKRLGVSQPAVSKALARLRSTFGDQLFIKTPQGMEPTVKATAMIAPMRNILSSVQCEILPSVHFDPSTAETTFTVALSEVGELLFLPVMVKKLQVAAPQTRVTPVYPTLDELASGLENGSIDVAVGIYPELQKNNFFRQRLSLSYISCLLRADHPFRGSRISLKQYFCLKHVAVRAGHSMQVIQKALQSGELSRDVVLMTSHYLIVPEIVKETDMVATLITNLAKYFAKTHTNLRVAEAPPEIPPVEIKQFWHRKYNNEPRSKWLRAFIKSYMSK